MKKDVTAHYAAIQGVYWITYGLIFNFASMFLLDRGYSNAAIGLMLGLSYGLSALLQPVLAALFTRLRVRLNVGIAAVCALIAILAVGAWMIGGTSVALSCIFVAILTLQSSLQPSVNSLQRDFELAGVRVNFGLARGVGSAAFAVMCFVVGQMMRNLSPKLLPIFYCGTAVVLIVLLCLFRAPSHECAAVRPKKGASILREQPMFALFCLGLVGLSASHIFIDNFYLQIIRNIGGDSGSQGIAVAIAAILELPAMALFARVSRRTGSGRLLILAGWVWLVKDALTFVANSVGVVYVAAVLQVASYAIYVPATVGFVTRVFPDRFLSAQALTGSSFTVGSLISTLVGGSLIDLLGVKTAQAAMLVPALIGAVLWTLSVTRLGRNA